MKKIEYNTIPNDALIDIKISGAFYAKLSNLLIKLASSMPEEEFKTLMSDFKDNKQPKNTTEFTIHILFSLIYEIENNAKKQNKIVIKEIDIDKLSSNVDAT